MDVLGILFKSALLIAFVKGMSGETIMKKSGHRASREHSEGYL